MMFMINVSRKSIRSFMQEDVVLVVFNSETCTTLLLCDGCISLSAIGNRRVSTCQPL